MRSDGDSVCLALVHHANQYVLGNGYSDRQGICEILGLRNAPLPQGPLVQVHGQFRHIHVFIQNEVVTVIDLDRSCPSDPAQDVAEFIHRMRTKGFKASNGANCAKAATRAFLEEYGAQKRDNLVNLPFYWAYHTLVPLWRFMKSSVPEDPAWQPMVDFYLSEFEAAVSYRHND